MKYFFLLCLFITQISPSFGSENYIDVNIGSKHGDPEYCYQGSCKPFNQSNLGLGLTQTLTNHIELKEGFYKNSYYHTSVYFGGNLYTTIPTNTLNIKPGVMVGVITGYKHTPYEKSVLPMVIPNISLGTNHVRATVGYLPKLSSDYTSVITLQLQFRY